MGIILNCIDEFHIATFGVGLIAVAISVGIILSGHLGINGRIESMKREYQAIVYKIDSEDARDKFGFLNKQIIDEVQEWNCDLAFNKENQKDFWIGIYIPNIYDEFEYIDYK